MFLNSISKKGGKRMLSAKMAEILLTVYPELNDLKRAYGVRAEKCLGFGYNCTGREAEVILGEYIDAIAMHENLGAFKNCMDTALKMLLPDEYRVVESVFFKKESLISGSNRLGLEPNSFRYRREKSVKKLRSYIEILGFPENKILGYFDSEPVFVDAAKEIDSRRESAKRFRNGKGNKT